MTNNSAHNGFRKSVPRLFADLTAALEDLHGIAVEGQRDDLSPDMQMALMPYIRSQIVRLDRIATSIAKAVARPRP